MHILVSIPPHACLLHNVIAGEKVLFISTYIRKTRITGIWLECHVYWNYIKFIQKRDGMNGDVQEKAHSKKNTYLSLYVTC